MTKQIGMVLNYTIMYRLKCWKNIWCQMQPFSKSLLVKENPPHEDFLLEQWALKSMFCNYLVCSMFWHDIIINFFVRCCCCFLFFFVCLFVRSFVRSCVRLFVCSPFLSVFCSSPAALSARLDESISTFFLCVRYLQRKEWSHGTVASLLYKDITHKSFQE